VALPLATALAAIGIAAIVVNVATNSGSSTRRHTPEVATFVAVGSPRPGPTTSVLAIHHTRSPSVALHRTRHHAGHHQGHRAHGHGVAAPALRIVDTGSACYVQVTADGHVLKQRILHGHQHLTFRRHGLDVVLGNAGGVRIAFGGHRLHRAGRSGQVRRFRIR
jgi:hypothetical protein